MSAGASNTPSISLSNTISQTASVTVTNIPSNTATGTPSNTIATSTSTVSSTVSRTPSIGVTASATISPSVTASRTPSNSISVSITPSPSSCVVKCVTPCDQCGGCDLHIKGQFFNDLLQKEKETRLTSNKRAENSFQNLCGCSVETILDTCHNFKEREIKTFNRSIENVDTRCSHSHCECHQSHGWLMLAAQYFTVLENTLESGCLIPGPGCNIAEATHQAKNCLFECPSALSSECINLIRVLDEWNSGDCQGGPDLCHCHSC